MKRILIVALTTLALVGVLVVVGIALNRYLDPFDDRPFSSAAWKVANTQDRGPMARDAIRHLPPGTPATRVRELLGEGGPVPGIAGSPVDGFGHRLEHPVTWSYYLGCWSGLGPYRFDSAFLYVHFGPDGGVVAAEITGG